MAKAKLGVKHCPRCGRTLLVSEVYQNKKTNDGLQIYCKDCSNKLVNKNSDNKTMLIKKLVKMLEPYRTK